METHAPDLPAPVGRFLSRANPAGRRIATLAMFQRGRLRADPRRPQWSRFHAVHTVFPEEVRFAWSARVWYAGLLPLRVRDRLENGVGSGAVSLGPFPLGRSVDSPEMNAGTLHRFLAEAVWFPSALRPSERLRWTPIDDRRALATLTDHGTTVSLEFRFGAAGEVEGVHTPARWGRFDGGFRLAAWEGRFAEWGERDGLWVPSRGEVGWHLDGTYEPVWEGRITSARYVFDG